MKRIYCDLFNHSRTRLSKLLRVSDLFFSNVNATGSLFRYLLIKELYDYR